MSSKLNVETFVAVLKKSGLIEPDRLQRLIADYTAQGGIPDDSPKLADFLVANAAVTRWQAEKLLQGKHKGYFLGKYRLLSLLGKGGMSSVYLAEHVLMRRRCALKVLPTKRVNDSSYLARFHREAQAVASLDHPNIVRAYDVDHQADRDSEIHFLVMEYVEGQSLQELVQRSGVCGFLDAAEYIRQAALGLQHAHEAGMVHRDVKPGNLLVDPNGTVKVLDLGLARFFTGDEGEDALTIRHDEKVLGTADYLAPEQALDSHTVDARADIYSLGCTLYFLLTGRPPFTEGTLAQRLMAHQTKTPPAIESLRPETPTSLVAIVGRMMAKQADERYATAKTVAETLFNWLDAHADPAWRKDHSAIFGPRSTEPPASARIPVAKPILAMPVAQPVPPATAVTYPTVVQAPVPAPAAPVGPAPVSPPAPAPVSGGAIAPELSNFFAALSDSQKVSQSSSKPATKPSPSTILTASAPPHLKPGTGATPPTPINTTSAEPPAFPNFTTAPAEPQQPFALSEPAPKSSTKAPKPSPVPRLPWKFPLPLPIPVLGAVAGGVVLVVLMIAFAMGWFGGSSSSSSSLANLPPWPADKRETTVGPNGEFRSIVDALRVVRRRFEPSGAAGDLFVIRIAAGTYAENISIDGTVRRSSRRDRKAAQPTEPDWPHGIKLLADGEVILAPAQDVPAIRLRNLPRFTVEGITVQAAGRPVAIELSGDLNESRLTGLTIRGFSQTGVLCQGAQGISFGNSHLVLEKLRFEPNSDASGATAIRLERSADDGDCSHLIIRQCRMLGPLAVGLAVSGMGPYNLTITENLFAKAQEAIRLEGTGQWKDILVLNNTFFEGRHGIVFSAMPADGSQGFSFRRNLFTKLSGAEAIVLSGYDAGRFQGMLADKGLDANFSDRPKPATPQTGEITALCESNGKRGETGFAFASTDVANEKFLMPTDKSVQRQVPGNREPEKAWVGAFGP